MERQVPVYGLKPHSGKDTDIAVPQLLSPLSLWRSSLL